jgi:energy-converting hydrogenase Eha subunit B
MNVFHFVAAAGLLGLAGGMFLVNIVSTPRAAQSGIILASCGVVLLAVLAIRQLLP